MTAALSLQLRRRAPLGREELRRQLLALVLAAVLVWYTLVVPAHAGARISAGLSPEDEGQDGEVRGVGDVAPSRAADAQPADSTPDADLDWPEYIYPD
jgi:hypothetical protein